MLRGAGGVQAYIREMQETDAIIGGESLRRTDGKGPYTRKGRHLCGGPSGGDDSCQREEAVGDSGGYQEGNMEPSIWRSGITGLRQRKRNESITSLWEERKPPEMPFETDHVSYMDGCKVYFKNGGGLLPDSLVRNRCFAYSVRWNMNRIQSGCAICLKNIWDCRNRPDRQEI